LRTLAKLYRLTDEGYARIQPEFGAPVTRDLIQRYLLGCIRENITDDKEIFSRFEAAQTLHAWFRHLIGRDSTDGVVRSAAKAVRELFLNGDSGLRDSIAWLDCGLKLRSAGGIEVFLGWKGARNKFSQKFA